MNIFNLLTLLGGLAMFLFGMEVMGKGLEKKAGGKLKSILEKLTANRFRGVLLGFFVTAVIQSSGATTVMVVGFVNSGLMKLSQAVGVIMGANIGTTVTAWLLSLTSITGDSVWIQLLKPSSFSPVLAAIGIIFFMFTKKKKDTGSILLGFAVLMFGMQTMTDAAAPLAQVPEFQNLLVLFSNPLLGMVVGALVTAAIQSSSATVGILQALSATGQVTYGTALPIIMGQNIGSCVTALISSVGTNKNARRTSFIHLTFNVFGSLIFLGLFYALRAIFDFSFVNSSIDQVGIATIHTIFNIFTTAILLPFANLLEKLACFVIKDAPGAEPLQILDDRLLTAPSLAVSQCKKLTVEMAETAHRNLTDSLTLLRTYDEKEAERIIAAEEQIDQFEDRLGSYLVKLSGQNLSDAEGGEVSELLHNIGDIERIGDHAANIQKSAQEMYEKKIAFSAEALDELQVLTMAMLDVLQLSIDAFRNEDIVMAGRVEPLEQVCDALKNELRMRHVARLQRGACTIELGFIFSDILTDCERVADHCSNIAVCVIETRHGSFDTHSYLGAVKSSGEEFKEQYEQYLKKYVLP